MSEPRLLSAAPADPLRRTARLGRAEGAAGVTARLRTGLAIATLAARKGAGQALADAVQGRFGCPLPAPGRVESGPEADLLWIGPGQWLAVADERASPGFARRCAADLSGLASVCDQSDGREVVRLSGPRVLDVLAKGIAVDLDPLVFGPGSVATTAASHVGVALWRPDGTGSLDVAVARSFWGSFWHFVSDAAAEYGLDIGEPLPGREVRRAA